METLDTPGLQDWDDVKRSLGHILRRKGFIPWFLTALAGLRGAFFHSRSKYSCNTDSNGVRETAPEAADATKHKRSRTKEIKSSDLESPAAAARGALPAIDDDHRHSDDANDGVDGLRSASPSTMRRSGPRRGSSCKAHPRRDLLHDIPQSNSYKAYEQAHIVHVLTSFIEAHEYAQERIPFYLGETEGIDTAEEAMVVEESQELVREAQLLLAALSPEVVTRQISRQIASWILYTQEGLIEEFQAEGIITQKSAEVLLEEVKRDFDKLGHPNPLRLMWAQVLDQSSALWVRVIDWFKGD